MTIALVVLAVLVFLFALSLTPPGVSFRRRMMAKHYDKTVAKYEVYIADRKRALFADLAGSVLELGPGTGANFTHLPDGVEHWTGIEPNPHMHAQLRAAGARRGMAAEFRQVTAGAMDVPDASVDVVLSTLVLCSVPDPQAVVRDIHRVLRPGGRFVFIEHVAAPRGTGLRRLQRTARPFWRYFADGCCPDRELADVIRSGGFASVDMEAFRAPKDVMPGIVSPHVAGIAIK
jgi:SAM-dependent methyltransferase